MESRVSGSSRQRAESPRGASASALLSKPGLPEWSSLCVLVVRILGCLMGHSQLSRYQWLQDRRKSLRLYLLRGWSLRPCPWFVVDTGVWLRCPQLIPQAAFSSKTWKYSFPLLSCVPQVCGRWATLREKGGAWEQVSSAGSTGNTFSTSQWSSWFALLFRVIIYHRRQVLASQQKFPHLPSFPRCQLLVLDGCWWIYPFYHSKLW